jgi:hypothetical protein
MSIEMNVRWVALASADSSSVASYGLPVSPGSSAGTSGASPTPAARMASVASMSSTSGSRLPFSAISLVGSFAGSPTAKTSTDGRWSATAGGVNGCPGVRLATVMR